MRGGGGEEGFRVGLVSRVSLVCRQDIPSLPGVSRWGVTSVLSFLAPAVKLGLSAVLLFGVPERAVKMEDGRAGESEAVEQQ